LLETNRAVEFGIYIARATEERLVLRTASLTEFITKTKGKKREEIAKIIGYEAIEDFRTVIQKTQNSLEKRP